MIDRECEYNEELKYLECKLKSLVTEIEDIIEKIDIVREAYKDGKQHSPTHRGLPCRWSDGRDSLHDEYKPEMPWRPANDYLYDTNHNSNV